MATAAAATAAAEPHDQLCASLDACVQGVLRAKDSTQEETLLRIKSFLKQVENIRSSSRVKTNESSTTGPEISKEIKQLTEELKMKRNLVRNYEAKLEEWKKSLIRLREENEETLEKAKLAPRRNGPPPIQKSKNAEGEIQSKR
mmetsp:Transcript_22006/g.35572  ORF Transcript_22006/g.35572 Transcript_22006/m.35572 type:complete len:144 (-) Transcript_22006:113-544(-)